MMNGQDTTLINFTCNYSVISFTGALFYYSEFLTIFKYFLILVSFMDCRWFTVFYTLQVMHRVLINVVLVVILS
jgi:hypothetical protein